MKQTRDEAVLSILPDVPALQVVWVGCEVVPLYGQIVKYVESGGGVVVSFGPQALELLDHGAPRGYEVLILNPESIRVDGVLLQACWHKLENSATLLILGRVTISLEQSGFSNPSEISFAGEVLTVAHKSFAWGTQ